MVSQTQLVATLVFQRAIPFIIPPPVGSFQFPLNLANEISGWVVTTRAASMIIVILRGSRDRIGDEF